MLFMEETKTVFSRYLTSIIEQKEATRVIGRIDDCLKSNHRTTCYGPFGDNFSLHTIYHLVGEDTSIDLHVEGDRFKPNLKERKLNIQLISSNDISDVVEKILEIVPSLKEEGI